MGHMHQGRTYQIRDRARALEASALPQSDSLQELQDFKKLETASRRGR